MRRRHPFHLRLVLVLLAWLAQLCLPVAHAALAQGGTASAGGAAAWWCGEPARMALAIDQLPAEIRQALQQEGDHGPSAEHLGACAELCSIGGTLAPPPLALPPQAAPQAGCEPIGQLAPAPVARAQSPTPPAQAPPVQAA
jgi:hypothetical protein